MARNKLVWAALNVLGVNFVLVALLTLNSLLLDPAVKGIAGYYNLQIITSVLFAVVAFALAVVVRRRDPSSKDMPLFAFGVALLATSWIIPNLHQLTGYGSSILGGYSDSAGQLFNWSMKFSIAFIPLAISLVVLGGLLYWGLRRSAGPHPAGVVVTLADIVALSIKLAALFSALGFVTTLLDAWGASGLLPFTYTPIFEPDENPVFLVARQVYSLVLLAVLAGLALLAGPIASRIPGGQQRFSLSALLNYRGQALTFFLRACGVVFLLKIAVRLVYMFSALLKVRTDTPETTVIDAILTLDVVLHLVNIAVFYVPFMVVLLVFAPKISALLLREDSLRTEGATSQELVAPPLLLRSAFRAVLILAALQMLFVSLNSVSMFVLQYRISPYLDSTLQDMFSPKFITVYSALFVPTIVLALFVLIFSGAISRWMVQPDDRLDFRVSWLERPILLAFAEFLGIWWLLKFTAMLPDVYLSLKYWTAMRSSFWVHLVEREPAALGLLLASIFLLTGSQWLIRWLVSSQEPAVTSPPRPLDIEGGEV